ncbi:diguanylate cyclase [candidate division KSB1 bacterium]|nr:diguanylate cyclase [candidate division KSB1 bacterium]
MNAKLGRILVVDDVPVNIQLLTTHLKAAGYEVIPARDGEEALVLVQESKPDLILLDVMMPKINGFEVCERIKSNSATEYIPVIMVTALNDIEHKIRGEEAGADDFISKPFNKMELLIRVRSLLRIKLLHDQLSEKIAELALAKERLRRLAITDGLTRLYNHRHFKEVLMLELDRAKRHNQSISVVMIDIDHFKCYNDTHGHQAGDVLLQQISRLYAENIRKIDLAARYGGEEFVLVLIETDKEAATIAANKIRSIVEHFPFENEETQPNGKITISMGVATFPEDAVDFDGLVGVADRRLYMAKDNGRNQVASVDIQPEHVG